MLISGKERLHSYVEYKNIVTIWVKKYNAYKMLARELLYDISKYLVTDKRMYLYQKYVQIRHEPTAPYSVVAAIRSVWQSRRGGDVP